MPIDRQSLMRRFSLRQLQVYEAVARLRSFTKASKELHLSQPTVSIQIKKLEQDIGVPLFEHLGRDLNLTEEGEALFRAARQVMEIIDNFEMDISNTRELSTGHLKLAVTTTAKYFAPRLLGLFCQRYPGIQVSLEVGSRDLMLDRLNRNLDDLYLLSRPPEDEHSFEAFLPNPVVMVAHKDHPLVDEVGITLEDLSVEIFILREKGSGTRLDIERMFKRAQQPLNVRMALGSNVAIKQAVLGGLGIAPLSVHTLISDTQLGELKILDVEGFPIQQSWYVGYHRNKQLSIVAEAFYQFLRNEGLEILDKNIQNTLTTGLLRD